VCVCECTRVDTGQVFFVCHSCPTSQMQRQGKEEIQFMTSCTNQSLPQRIGLLSGHDHARRDSPSRTNKALSESRKADKHDHRDLTQLLT